MNTTNSDLTTSTTTLAEYLATFSGPVTIESGFVDTIDESIARRHAITEPTYAFAGTVTRSYDEASLHTIPPAWDFDNCTLVTSDVRLWDTGMSGFTFFAAPGNDALYGIRVTRS